MIPLLLMCERRACSLMLDGLMSEDCTRKSTTEAVETTCTHSTADELNGPTDRCTCTMVPRGIYTYDVPTLHYKCTYTYYYYIGKGTHSLVYVRTYVHVLRACGRYT